jgi:hypothetical protein
MLAQELVQAFGEDHVFLDKDTLHAGNWREQINGALDHAQVVLVIIGRKWASITDRSNMRRLEDPTDVHRQEVAFALSRSDITVIPIRVDGAELPLPEELPDDLRSLTQQQSRQLSDNSAHRAVDLQNLIGDIERITGLKAEGAKTAKKTAEGRRLFSGMLLVTTALVSIVLLLMLDLALGWTLTAGEKSIVFLLVLLATLAVSWWRKRSRERKNERS